MDYDQFSSSRLYSPSIESCEEGDRGRLLTRIPGSLRSPGRPRTLRHTGPSIHHWLQRNKGSPVRNSPRDSSFDIANNALDSRSSRQGNDRGASPLSQSSLYAALSASSDFLGSTGPVYTQRQVPKPPSEIFANNNKYLTLRDEGVTVTRILSRSPDTPNQFIRYYDPCFAHDAARLENWVPRFEFTTPRRPTHLTAGMRYTALWEWICSDSVSTSRIDSARSDIPNPPGRFVEYENFAVHYTLPDDMSRASNAAADVRTE